MVISLIKILTFIILLTSQVFADNSVNSGGTLNRPSRVYGAYTPGNCLASNSGGLVVDAGTGACGSGSGGSALWAIAPGNVGIGTTQNVGIGTLSPTLALQVIGNVGIGTISTSSDNLVVSGVSGGLTLDGIVGGIGGIDSNTLITLPFDNSLIDLSNNNFTITNTNGVTFSNSIFKFGGFSASFNGASSQFLKTTSTTLFNNGSGDFETDFWVQPTSLPGSGGNVAMVSDWNGGFSAGWQLYLHNQAGTQQIVFGGTSNNLTGTATLSTSAMSFIELNRSGGTTQICVNGSQITSSASAMGGNGSGPLCIGTQCLNGVDNGLDFTGQIDEFRYNSTSRGSSCLPMPATPYTSTTTSTPITFNSAGTLGAQIKYSSANSVLSFVNSNGNIGIGSTNPGQFLDVQGTIRSPQLIDTAFGTGVLTPSGNTATVVTSTGSRPTNDCVKWDASGNAIDSGGACGGSAAGGTNAIQYNSGSATFAGAENKFSFNGTNVGIGTTNGVALLSINSSAAQDLFRVDDSAGTDATPFIIDQTGNVGIGTAVPLALLSVASTLNQPMFRVDDNGDADASPFIIDQNGNVGIGTSITQNDKLLIMGGNVGIGTWVPATALDLKGTLVVSQNVGIGSITPGFSLDINGGIRTAGNTSNSLLNTTGGNVGIGSTNPGAPLDVTGEIRSNDWAVAATGTVLCKKATGGIGYCATLVGVVCSSCT